MENPQHKKMTFIERLSAISILGSAMQTLCVNQDAKKRIRYGATQLK